MSSAPKYHGNRVPVIGAASAQFPGKLHDLMTFTEREGLSDIVSWVHNGRAILVHDPERLLKILPHFGFGQTKYRSFQRQLNMWHWQRIIAGPNKGGWIHPYFIRGKKLFCSLMSRNGTPKPNECQALLNFPAVLEPNNTTIVPAAPAAATATNAMNTTSRNDTTSEKIDFPWNNRNDSFPFSTTVLKTPSAPLKPPVDDWEPLPATCHDEDEHSTMLVGEGELLDFMVPFFDARLLPEECEPNPMLEENDMNPLLEPLSAEVFDNLF